MDAVSQSIGAATTTVATSSNTVKTPVAAVQADPSASASAIGDTTWSPKNFSQNVDQFKSVTSTILDTSGRYSYDERLKAYTNLYEMAAKGKLAGMASEDEKLFAKATFESDIGIKAAKIQQDGVTAHFAARARGENTVVARLKFIAELSDVDQKTNFAVTENGFDLSGNRQYADIDSYRNQLVANAIQSDPNGIGQALKGADSATLGGSWSTHILSLLSSNKAVTSDLSARSSISQPSFTPKMPLSYQPGNIYTRMA